MAQLDLWMQAVVEFMRTNQHGAVPIVFLVALGECVAVLSWLVPATMFFTAFGAVAGASGLDLVPLAFAASLCDHPPQTLLALHRTLEEGEIRERFRILVPRGDRPKDAFRAFEFVEVEGEDEIVERVDLMNLGKGGTP